MHRGHQGQGLFSPRRPARSGFQRPKPRHRDLHDLLRRPRQPGPLSRAALLQGDGCHRHLQSSHARRGKEHPAGPSHLHGFPGVPTSQPADDQSDLLAGAVPALLCAPDRRLRRRLHHSVPAEAELPGRSGAAVLPGPLRLPSRSNCSPFPQVRVHDYSKHQRPRGGGDHSPHQGHGKYQNKQRKSLMTSPKKTPTTVAEGQIDLNGLVAAHIGGSVRPGETLQQIAVDAMKQNGDAEERQTQFVRPWVNPTQLARPTYLLNFPFSYATQVANNPWMEDLSSEGRQPDFRRAAAQFLELYRYMAAAGALVYVLPTPLGADLQDLMYTANLGIVLEHLPGQNTVVISNFASPPRRGETPVGVNFFQSMGYEIHVPPTKFEGEAELKHLHDNVYVGGYGIRSEKETYDWMERNFDMRVVQVCLTDPYLYHLDCMVFPITSGNTLVCTELIEQEEIAALEKVTNVIPVSADECYSGICNSVRMPNTVMNSSHLQDLKAGTEEYECEIQKNRKLEDIAANLALEVSYFNLSEYHKSGALLSCMVMHLNRHSYKIALTAQEERQEASIAA